MEELFDAHTHLCLSSEDIPKYAFGWITPFLIKSDARASFVAKWLHRIIPFTKKDQLDRLSMLVKQNILSSRQRCEKYFKIFSGANVLLMDLEGSMNAGITIRSYEDQIIEAIQLKKEFNIKIYMFINPDRENMMDLVKKYYNDIDGYKYYPPLCGHIDNHFMNILLDEYPKDNVIIHTTNTSPIYDKNEDKEFCANMAHPSYCIPLINKFKKINFIFAHCGGIQWMIDCVTICSKYKNAYVDISYTFENEDLWKELNHIITLIPKKILFGTDWYMINFNNFLKIKNIDIMLKNNKRIFKL
jgi:predicted TIM-barrel fold metal-dependent hydrolase